MRETDRQRNRERERIRKTQGKRKSETDLADKKIEEQEKKVIERYTERQKMTDRNRERQIEKDGKILNF